MENPQFEPGEYPSTDELFERLLKNMTEPERQLIHSLIAKSFSGADIGVLTGDAYLLVTELTGDANISDEDIVSVQLEEDSTILVELDDGRKFRIREGKLVQ